MEASRAEIALRIDECSKLAKYCSVGADDHRCKFDYAVISIGVQPCRLDIDDSNTSHAGLP
jgi:hypothetical protein